MLIKHCSGERHCTSVAEATADNLQKQDLRSTEEVLLHVSGTHGESNFVRISYNLFVDPWTPPLWLWRAELWAFCCGLRRWKLRAVRRAARAKPASMAGAQLELC